MRVSASLVVVAPSSHVLFVLRPSKGSFPNAHVFPGGTVDPTDPSMEYCAARETYEETGLLLGGDGRTAVHSTLCPTYEKAIEKEFGSASNILQPGSISKLSNWVTPPEFPKRFATQFYIYKAANMFKFPDHSMTKEIEKVEWLTPLQALTLFKENKISIMPPQFYILTALLEKGVDGAIEAISERNFAPAVINRWGKNKLQMDWGQGESGILTFAPGGGVSSIEYIRANSAKL